MPAWEDIPEEQRPFQRRLMEVAAGFAEHADVQAGRVLDELERLGPAPRTRWCSTSGATTAPRARARTGRSPSCWPRTGSRRTVEHAHPGARGDGRPGRCLARRRSTTSTTRAGRGRVARRTQGMKLMASDLGGTRNPMAVRWPAEDRPRRDATLASFTTATTSSRRSMRSSGSRRRGSSTVSRRTRSTASASPTRSNDPDAQGRLITQYFEIMGSRAIYHDGWMASATGPRLPWVPGLPPGIKEWTPDQDDWRLYNLDEDCSQANDLAAQMPDKLAQMKETFAIEAARNSVYPVGGGLWIVAPSPRAADLHAVPRVELRPRHHPDARVLCAGARQPRESGDDRRRPAGERKRRPLCAGQLERRPHLPTSTTVTSVTSTTCSSSCAPRSAPSRRCRPGRRRSRSPPSTPRSSPAAR